MPSNQPVLYCYDGSDNARHALKVASGLFRDLPAVVVCVWQSAMGGMLSVPYATIPEETIQNADESLKQRAAGLCDEGREIVQGCHGDVQVRVEESIGSAWSTLVDVADELDASVIVTGWTNTSGGRRPGENKTAQPDFPMAVDTLGSAT